MSYYSSIPKTKRHEPSNGIRHYFYEKLSKDTKQPNIFNLETYFQTNPNPGFNNEYYKSCKTFIEKINLLIGNEINENNGNIIVAFPMDDNTSKDNEELEKIKALYTELYLEGIIQKPHHKINENNQIYPDYYDDLYIKGYKPYEKIETELGIVTEISKQSDSQFLDTLKKRIDGLKICISNPEGQLPNASEYFEKQLEKEATLLNTSISNRDLKNEESKNVIMYQCQKIYYSSDTLHKSKRITTDLEYQTEILNLYSKIYSQPDGKELTFARTFLPGTYFNEDNTIKLEMLKDLIISNNRIYRQFVFGFFDNPEFKYLRKLPPFLYEVGGMQQSIDRKTSCNPLVNWSILLNLLYCRCSIMNSEVAFPVRFIIPDFAYTKVLTKTGNDGYYDSNGNYIREIVIRDKIGLNDLFDNITPDNVSTKFIGVVTIKYNYFDRKKDTNSIRVWFLYVFRNNDFKNKSRRDLISGLHSKYFLTNSNLQFVNMGGIAERHNITHTELSYFVNMSQNKNHNNRLHFYCTKINNEIDRNNIFISKLDNLQYDKYFQDKLGLIKVEITLVTNTNDINMFPTKNFLFKYLESVNISPNISNISNIQQGGMNFKDSISLQISHNQDIFFSNDNNISGNFYNEYQLISLEIKKLVVTYEYKKLYEGFHSLYSYYLLEPMLGDKFSYMKIMKNKYDKQLSIAKYIPISSSFYSINELLKTYNIFHNLSKDVTIQYIGTNLGFIEAVEFNDYKINNINCLITTKSNYYKNIIDEWEKYINNLSKIYKMNIEKYNDSIYNLIENRNTNPNTKKFDIIYYDVYTVIKGVGLFESYYNTPNIFMGMMYGLQNININGTFILYLESVAYKHLADIYLIISKYFETSNLFYPEISNLYKKSGTFAIFQGYKGCDKNIILHLNNILEKIKTIYPNDGLDFNISDENIRNKYIITRSLTNESKHLQKIITGFINNNNIATENIYASIKEFNNIRYLKQVNFCIKLLNFIKNNDSVKFPTQEQIVNSILYCNKWGIEYWNKYDSKPFRDKFGKIILSETYGLHKPIMYNFKHPKKIDTLILSRSKTLKSVSKLKHKLTSVNKNLLNISNFMKDIDVTSKRHSKKIKPKSKNILISLLSELHYSNNRLQQVGYLIDSRRDLHQTNEILQNEKWWEINKRFRYYKHKDDMEKLHLDEIVRNKLKDNSISQAWLKMYEIITDCDIVPRNHKGTFNTFHICEAPGTFINALNNYIHTNTQYTNFEWNAQSLHYKKADIGDQFGLIRRHPNQWDWGVDGTGDITTVNNIKYYKKQVLQRSLIKLMTSDAGISMKTDGYEKLAFASLLAILYILPVNGTMVYKILTPIDEPLILNLVYIAYCNFKDLIFYKPVQNNHSREFYIIGKGYLGTEDKILDKFFNILENFKVMEKTDLFDDMYPEEFVRQFVDISNHMADNYIYTIERNIYYLDNFEKMTPDFLKLMKDYYNEKNQDWLEKYKPRRIESDVDKL
jgi:cap2 methyltransferase